jgi:hypothetical protein
LSARRNHEVIIRFAPQCGHLSARAPDHSQLIRGFRDWHGWKSRGLAEEIRKSQRLLRPGTNCRYRHGSHGIEADYADTAQISRASRWELFLGLTTKPELRENQTKKFIVPGYGICRVSCARSIRVDRLKSASSAAVSSVSSKSTKPFFLVCCSPCLPRSLCSLLITDFAEELLLGNVEIVAYVISKRPVGSFCYSYSLRYSNIGISNRRALSYNEPTALQR